MSEHVSVRWYHPARWAMGLIRLYQRAVSPLVGSNCRYYPTCSNYGLQAFRRHGFVRGGWLTIRRIGRCHPFHAGGYDPVPAATTTGEGAR